MFTTILGYLASTITLLSFLMKDIRKLRIINIVACVLFVIYGCLNKDVPIIIVNIAVALAHLYYLKKR